MWYVWETGECIQGCGWGDLGERNHFENLDTDGKIILKWISRK
jgi:hypothetical protein